MKPSYPKYISALIIFGSNGIVASRIAMTSYQIVLSRCFIGSLFLILHILFLGLINTGLGCSLYFSSIQKIPAQSVAIFSYLDPLSALLFSALLLNERLTFVQAAGALQILGGALFGELFHRKTPPPESDMRL